MSFRVEIDATDVKRQARAYQVLTAGDILEAARPNVFKSLNTAKNDIRDNLSGKILNRRSGQLAQAVDFEGPTVDANSLTARLGILRGPATAYADIHLTGGTIVPKNARKLAVPLPSALTASGVARYTSPLRVSLATAFPDGTFVAKDILFGKIGSTEIVPLFVLKDSVQIPKRDYMSDPLRTLLRSVAEFLSVAAARVLARTTNGN